MNTQRVAVGGALALAALILFFYVQSPSPPVMETLSGSEPDFRFINVTVSEYEDEAPLWTLNATDAELRNHASEAHLKGIYGELYYVPQKSVYFYAPSGTVNMENSYVFLKDARSTLQVGSELFRIYSAQLEWESDPPFLVGRKGVEVRSARIGFVGQNLELNLSTGRLRVFPNARATVYPYGDVSF